jgi:hypothetical protein
MTFRIKPNFSGLFYRLLQSRGFRIIRVACLIEILSTAIFFSTRFYYSDSCFIPFETAYDLILLLFQTVLNNDISEVQLLSSHSGCFYAIRSLECLRYFLLGFSFGFFLPDLFPPHNFITGPNHILISKSFDAISCFFFQQRKTEWSGITVSMHWKNKEGNVKPLNCSIKQTLQLGLLVSHHIDGNSPFFGKKLFPFNGQIIVSVTGHDEDANSLDFTKMFTSFKLADKYQDTFTLPLEDTMA